MAETTSYSEGVPCWVDAAATDVESAKQFYTALFGWDYLDAGPDSGGYWLATLRGKQVAGIGPTQSPEDRSAWTTYLWTDDAAAAAKLIADAGGSVLAEPMDVSDHGRMSIAADPSGAVFGLWQGTSHRGAGLANEHGAFTWNELPTPDTAAAREFYTAVFGYSYHPVKAPWTIRCSRSAGEASAALWDSWKAGLSCRHTGRSISRWTPPILRSRECGTTAGR